MKNFIKNWKTSILGAIAILVVFVALAFVWFGKTTLTEVGAFLGLFITFIGGLIGLYAKDQSKNKDE